MNFWKSLNGILEAELSSPEPERMLSLISRAGIEIWDLKQLDQVTCRFRTARSSKGQLDKLCGSTGAVIRYPHRAGLYWTLGMLKHRPVLAVGGAVLLAAVLWLPSRVFFVSVEGNERIPANRILEAAEACGIGFGASRREVRSEKMKNSLLSAVPELQWAGINTSGCTAVISVRERTDPKAETVSGAVSGIAAARDGYILSCTATSGNLLVRPGDTVKAGQLLVSAYTDCGLCIRAQRAEGEILAQTTRKLVAVTPQKTLVKQDPGRMKRKISLLLRKKRIFLWKDSGIWEGSCGRMYEEYYITLPGGFRLPFGLCVERYTFAELADGCLPEKEAEASLKRFAEAYLPGQMRGGTILSAEQTVGPFRGVYRLTGEYTCTEDIGILRQEKIGEENEQNSRTDR